MSRDVVKLYWPVEQCSVSALSKHAVKRNCPYIIIDDSHGFSSVSKYRGNREANTAHAVLQLIPKKVSQRNCFTDAVFKCVQRIREFVRSERIWTRSKDAIEYERNTAELFNIRGITDCR